MTNADKIRAMTDEELADQLAFYLLCDLCPISGCDGMRISTEKCRAIFVVLPEGHGRLGDLDVLYKYIERHEFTMNSGDMLEVIENADTILEAEGGLRNDS